MTKNLIHCEDCNAHISKSAEVCPNCGRRNEWKHRTFLKIEAYIQKTDRDIEYTIDGNTMSLSSLTTNIRQKIGIFLGLLSMPLLLSGFFSEGLMTLALFTLILGGVLTLFGLSAFERKVLIVDLKNLSFDTRKYDVKFWSEVIDIAIGSDISDDTQEENINKQSSIMDMHKSHPGPGKNADVNSKSSKDKSDKDESVIAYWFSSPKQSIITIVGFASIIWLCSQFLTSDKSKLLSCAEQMMDASANGVSPGAYANYHQLHSEIDNSNEVEILKIDKQAFGNSTISTYHIILDGKETKFIAGDC